MNTLRITKGQSKLLMDRNRDQAFVNMTFDDGGVCMFLDADDLARLGVWATGLSRELKREVGHGRLGADAPSGH
jgi:hypothetical protein